MSYYEPELLKDFCSEILLQLGVPEADTRIVADALVKANLEGVDSHGISRLPIYSQRVMEGRINNQPNIRFTRNAPSVLTVDGDNGLGQIVSYHSVLKGIEVVKETGMAAVAVKNSNHFGTASYFCQLASEQNLVAICFTNSPPGVAPWGGKTAFFGTNPIAFGFPTGNETPVIIDLSTSIVARGKIILAAKQGQEIPIDWAIDENGEQTTDPNEALKGAVLPLGGAKGSALALAVEILTGVLTGGVFGPSIANIYDSETSEAAKVGHFFILLDIEKFLPFHIFTEQINQLLAEIKAVPKVPNEKEIRYPGERRKREFDQHTKEGIQLSESIEAELMMLGKKLKVTFPTEILRETEI